MKNPLILAISILIVITFAVTTALAQGDTGFITITNTNLQIISDGAPRAFIYVTMTNDGCTNHIPELVMDSTNHVAGAMYATLLTAKATGKQVDIETNGCTTDGFPIVTAIYLGS